MRRRLVDLAVVLVALCAWLVASYGTSDRWRPFNAPHLVDVVAEGGVRAGLTAAGARLVAGGPIEMRVLDLGEPREVVVEGPEGPLRLVLGDGPAGGAFLELREDELALGVRQEGGSPRILPLGERPAHLDAVALRFADGAYRATADGRDLGEPVAGPPPDGRAGLRLLARGATILALEAADAGGRRRRVDSGEDRAGWWGAAVTVLWAWLGLVLTRLWWADRRGAAPRRALAVALLAPAVLAAGLVLRLVEDNRARLLEPPRDVAAEPLARDGPREIAPGRPFALPGRVDGDAVFRMDLELAPDSALDVAVRASPAGTDRQVLVTVSTDPALPCGVALNHGTHLEAERAEVRAEPGRVHRLAIRADGARVEATLDGRPLGAVRDLDLRAGGTALHALSGRATLAALGVEPLGAPAPLRGLLARWALAVAAGIALGTLALARVSGRPVAAAAAAWPLALAATPGVHPALFPFGAAAAGVLMLATPPRGARVVALLAAAVVLGTAGWARTRAPRAVGPAELNALDPSDVAGDPIAPDYVWARHPLVRRFNGYVRQQTFRGATVEPRPAPGTRRVITVGTSSTNGYGVRPEETFTALLGELLRTGGLAVETVNAGVPGATAERLRFFLEGVLLDLAPDLVVIDLGFNDHITGAVHDERAHFAAMTSTGISPLERALARWRAARARREFGRYRLAPAEAVAPEQVTRFTDRAAERYAATLTDMVRACRAAGARVLLVQEPVRSGAHTRQLRAFHAAMGRVAEAEDVALASAQDELGEAEGAFIDAVHPTPAGHRVLARILASAIAGGGLLED